MQGAPIQSVPIAAHKCAPPSRVGQSIRAAAPTTSAPIPAVCQPNAARLAPITAVVATSIPPAPKWPRSVSRPHSQPMKTAARIVSPPSSGPPSQAESTPSGTRTTAERMRRPRASRLEATSGSAIAPLAAVKLAERALQIRLGEIRPKRVDEDELGIGGLPEEEIAEPLLAAGADDEIRVGHISRQQVTGK